MMVLEILRRANVAPSLAIAVIVLTLALAVLEGAGLGMMIPILTYVEVGANGNPGASGELLGFFGVVLGDLGLQISLPVLIAIAIIPLMLRQGVFYLKTVLAARIEFDYMHTLRIRSVDLYLRAGLPFFLQHTQGALTSSVTLECEQASSILRGIIEIAGHLVLLATYLLILMLLSYELTLIAFPMLLLSMVMIRRQLVRGREYGHEIGLSSQSFNEAVSDTIQSIRLIKSRGIEADALKRLTAHSANLSNWRVILQRIRSGIEAVVNPVLLVGTFGVLYVAVQYLGMRLAELGMFLFVVARVTPLLIQFNSSRLTIQSASQVSRRVNDLCDRAAAYEDLPSGQTPFEGINDNLEFRNVSFSYQGDNGPSETLMDVSFKVQKGETIALVGPSGAGKSTIADLMSRIYDVTEGEVLIDGRPIQQFDLRSLRRRIAFVPQDPSFFHDTIRANIEVGLEKPLTDEELATCLQKSFADEFVSRLPKGVDTVIGERGLMISGGQRQRLAIARALAQDADILILDEPTSALDAASEAKVRRSIKKMHGEITVVIIAHRLSTVRDADKIILLENGRVAGEGDHASLIAGSAGYRHLVQIQELHPAVA